MQIKVLKDIVQDCHLNFLIGSGLSSPFLRTLGNIEDLITKLEKTEAPPLEKDLVRVSLYKCFFESALVGNLDVLTRTEEALKILSSYEAFIGELNTILLRRKSTILSKEINLFTTNVDVFLEHALETLNLEVNDGFNGRFNPLYNLSNFKTSRFKKSLHFDNVAELPIFNLLKLHGSLCWELNSQFQIAFSGNLNQIKVVKELLTAEVEALEIGKDSTVPALLKAAEGKVPTEAALAFMAGYDKLPIVNPTKEKFKHTLLNQTYYELLRLFSNELEKENTVLFALGFSFSDEHIREITIRSLNSNPTLAVVVIAYDDKSAEDLRSKFPPTLIRNKNILIMQPPLGEPDDQGKQELLFRYSLDEMSKHVFGKLLPTQPTDLPSEEQPTSKIVL